MSEKRILIVDDEPIFLRTIATHLRKAGFASIFQLADPRRVFEAIADHDPDMILLDIYMPEVTGQDILERICGHPEFDHIICLMVSSAGDEEEGRALETGALGFIPKPVDADVLVRTVAATFRIADHFGAR